MKNVFVIFLLFYIVFLFGNSIRHLLIGLGKIKHPMFDSDEKRRYIFRKGIIGLSGAVLFGTFIIYVVIRVVF